MKKKTFDRTQLSPIKSHGIGFDDELWDSMAKAVEKGDYKNVSALVRIAVVELLGVSHV